MPDSISWTFKATGSSGGSSADTGKTEVDGVLTAHRTVAKATSEDLKLQLDTTAKVVFLAITSSANDGKVKIKATGAAEIPMQGPLVLHGDAIALFASDLTKVTVNNTATSPVDVSILVGLKLV